MPVDLRTTHFRFGNDDGTEATHTFKANEDVNISLIKTGIFLLRFQTQESGATAAANTDYQFQYNLNGAGWNNITTSSAVVRAVAVGAFVDGANCTKRLTGTGTFETTGAGCTEDGTSGGTANDIAASGCSETECGLQLQSGDVADGDSIQFRLTSPDWTITNNVVPTITVLDNVTVTPDVGAGTLTGFVPTVTATAHVQASPALGALLATGFAPTVVIPDPQTATPALGELAAAGLAPVVTASNHQSASPGLGALAAAGLVPTVGVSDNQSAAPALGEVAATGFAPSIAVSDNQSAAPGVGEAALNGLAPAATATNHQTVATALGALDLAGLAPTATASDHQVVTPGVGAPAFTGFAPVVELPVVVTPGVGALALNGLAPSADQNVEAVPGAGVASLSGFAPTVTASDHQTVNVARGELTFTGFVPTVELPVVSETGTGAAILIGFSPVAEIPGDIEATPGAGELIAEGFPLTVTVALQDGWWSVTRTLVDGTQVEVGINYPTQNIGVVARPVHRSRPAWRLYGDRLTVGYWSLRRLHRPLDFELVFENGLKPDLAAAERLRFIVTDYDGTPILEAPVRILNAAECRVRYKHRSDELPQEYRYRGAREAEGRCLVGYFRADWPDETFMEWPLDSRLRVEIE